MSIDMSNIKYFECHLDDWHQIIDIAAEFQGGWAFRGQADSRWNITSGFERVLYGIIQDEYFCRDEGNNRFIEDELIDAFSRQAHIYGITGEKKLPKLEYLSMIQHHGGATRLLDVSSSFYVALFFALESSYCESAAVWAFNHAAIYERFSHIVPQKYWDFHCEVSARNLAEDIFSGSSYGGGFFIVQPWRLTERMILQQGAFLFPMQINASFESNICSMFGDDDRKSLPQMPVIEYDEFVANAKTGVIQKNTGVIKFVIGHQCFFDFLSHLRVSNISSATLFPGLDGFSRSLRFWTESCARYTYEKWPVK